MVFTFSKFVFDIDVEKTKAYYDIAKFVSEDCSCSGCRNYEKAIDFLPKEIISFFTKLGIEMKKIREVYVNCTNADDTVLYGGFYHVCGKLIKGDSAWISDNPTESHWDNEKAYAITDDFRVSYQQECSLLDNNFPLPAIQLEILANIPWVLDKNIFHIIQ